MSYTIFITGATGYLGQAIAWRLASDGHEVHGLTRSDAKRAQLQAIGVRSVVGNLLSTATFMPVLERCDALVHVASDHDIGPSEVDARALGAFEAAARRGGLKRMIYTSGLWVHGETGATVADETTPLAPLELVRWRVEHEQRALGLAEHGVAVAVLRPGIIYGESRGIIGGLFDEAKRDGVMRIPGDGAQHWRLVHRDDLADAYAIVLERAPSGAIYLVEEGSTLSAREVIDAAARAAGARTKVMDAARVIETFGLFGKALMADVRIRSTKLQGELGWVPKHSFATDVEAVFQEWKSARAAAAG